MQRAIPGSLTVCGAELFVDDPDVALVESGPEGDLSASSRHDRGGHDWIKAISRDPRELAGSRTPVGLRGPRASWGREAGRPCGGR